jgi:hypothetical protein
MSLFMSQTNTAVTLDGLFKTKYGPEGPIQLISDMAIIQDAVPFTSAQRTGKDYEVPIVVSSAQGFSYGLADATITLNTEIAATLKNVSVKGAQIVGQASLNYDAASRSEGSMQAFDSAAHFVVKDLFESHSRKLEMTLLHGSRGIAAVSSLASQVISLTSASFSEGCFIGCEGMKIDVYQADKVTLRQAGLVITAIDPSAYTLTVTGTTTGIAVTDVVFVGGSQGNECYGLLYIAENNASLFGVDASAYSLWKASSYSASSAALTMSKVLSGASQGIARGGLARDATLFVHASSWNNLNADQAGLRQYVDEKSSAQNGFNEITYRAPNGKINVVMHPMMPRGLALMVDPKSLKRVGSQDISANTPGKSGEIFMHSNTLSAYILRTYSNQAIVCEKPATMVLFNNIVPS